MKPVSISELQDPRVAEYRGVSDPELLRRSGLFVAEGRLVVRRLLSSGRFCIRSLFLTRAAADQLSDLLPLVSPGVPVYIAGREVMGGVAGFNVHRGCLALAERPPLPAREAILEGDPRTIVALEGVGNPDNVGGVFRNAAALGGDAVLLDAASCDPLYRKAIRVSMAAALSVPYWRDVGWPGDLDWLRERGFGLVGLTPAADAQDLGAAARVWRGRRLVLVLGNEGDGLSQAALARCEVRARIPMRSGVDSLNVAVTAGIALHRLVEPAPAGIG